MSPRHCQLIFLCPLLLRLILQRHAVLEDGNFAVVVLFVLCEFAACHGQPISVERLADIGGVFGVGLLYRYVARTLVGLVPGVGWLLKGAVGYAGTVATGQALSLRFNPDAPSPREGVERVRDTITQLSRSAADVARVARGEARPAPAATEPAAQVVEAASALPASQPADDYLTIGQQQ